MEERIDPGRAPAAPPNRRQTRGMIGRQAPQDSSVQHRRSSGRGRAAPSRTGGVVEAPPQAEVMRRLLIQISPDDDRTLQHLAARDERGPDWRAPWLPRARLALVNVTAVADRREPVGAGITPDADRVAERATETPAEPAMNGRLGAPRRRLASDCQRRGSIMATALHGHLVTRTEARDAAHP
jgi:hypothetical protein